MVSRQGENGVLKSKASLIFAAFPHSTSRAQDPQLHIHTILLNIGIRHDGSTGTLEPRELFRHQLAAGALFRAELAFQLEWRLGLRAIREGRAFELVGVDRTLIAEFSKRRAEIEAVLKRKGWSGAAAAEFVALDTRKQKEAVPRSVLFERWQELGRKHGWSTPELASLLSTSYPSRNQAAERAETSAAAITELTRGRNYFGKRHLLQAVAEEAQGRGFGARAAILLTKAFFQSPELVPLTEFRGEPMWTTREVLRLERELFRSVDLLTKRQSPLPNASVLLAQALSLHPRLNLEQRAALSEVSSCSGGLSLVQGMAGTGKSTLFRAAREIWEAEGLTVQGAALAGKAARGLEESTGIPSQTLHRTLQDLNRGLLELGSNSVLLLDEAAMIGTRQLLEVVRACEETGAKLVLCGDPKQLQAIERGGSFAALTRRLGASELIEIVRQRDPWAREVVRDFANGEAGRALGECRRHGLVREEGGETESAKKLIGEWKVASNEAPGTALILAGRVEDVCELNRLAQAERANAGKLSGTGVLVGAESFFLGDRVLFTRNSVDLGVMNGDLGTVLAATGSVLEIALDAQKKVTLDTNQYSHIRLGYALTAHKAQGATFDRSFVLTGAGQDRELTYVEASRASHETRWYLGDNFDSTVRQMQQSHEKLLATELVPDGIDLELILQR